MAQYDITIIGGGSGGLTAAQIAQSLGARVLLIEKERLGGDCLRYGCVPSKSLIHVARLVRQAQEAVSLDLAPTDLSVDMGKVSAYIQNTIQRVEETEKAYTRDVAVRFGTVTFTSAKELLINNELISSRNTLIATGSRPTISLIEGLQTVGYLTNEDVFNLTELPRSLVIVGGGPVGVELGQALARLGTQVTIVQGPDRLLPREDAEVSTLLNEILNAEGIEVITGARSQKVELVKGKKVITVRCGGQTIQLEADEILLAVGRQPNVEGLHLEAAGVTYSAKGIEVDEHLQTSTPNILAIGDVIGGYLFTHVAAYHAGVAVRNALLPIAKKKVDYRVVPWCTFTDPEVAHVGLTQAEAEQRHAQVRVVKLPWSNIDRAQTQQETTGFIKLVLAGKKDEIVGAHLIGAHAGELLGEITLTMQHKLSINDIFNTIHAYPTMSTGLQQAAFAAYLTGAEVVSNRKIVQAALRLRR